MHLEFTVHYYNHILYIIIILLCRLRNKNQKKIIILAIFAIIIVIISTTVTVANSSGCHMNLIHIGKVSFDLVNHDLTDYYFYYIRFCSRT